MKWLSGKVLRRAVTRIKITAMPFRIILITSLLLSLPGCDDITNVLSAKRVVLLFIAFIIVWMVFLKPSDKEPDIEAPPPEDNDSNET